MKVAFSVKYKAKECKILSSSLFYTTQRNWDKNEFRTNKEKSFIKSCYEYGFDKCIHGIILSIHVYNCSVVTNCLIVLSFQLTMACKINNRFVCFNFSHRRLQNVIGTYYKRILMTFSFANEQILWNYLICFRKLRY